MHKIIPDATCMDVENPQIAVPMKSPSNSQPAQMANTRVPTTHLIIEWLMVNAMFVDDLTL